MPLRCGDALKRRSIYKHGEYGSGARMHGFLHVPLHRYVTGCGVYLFLRSRYLLACTFVHSTAHVECHVSIANAESSIMHDRKVPERGSRSSEVLRFIMQLEG